MTGRIYTSADYAALKNAFRRACQQAGGGLREIAGMTRLSSAQLSRFGDISSDQFAPADVMLDIDSLAGAPIITRALAGMLGYDLVPAGQPVVAACFSQHLADLARESGDAVTGLATALADGKLTPRELADIDRDLSDLDAQVHSLGASVRAKIMQQRGEG